MTKKLYLPALLSLLLLGGCTSYFSKYQTRYRIVTTNGQHYYSDSKPDFDKSAGVYELEDLDGNEFRLKQGLIHSVEKYKYRK